MAVAGQRHKLIIQGFPELRSDRDIDACRRPMQKPRKLVVAFQFIEAVTASGAMIFRGQNIDS